MQHAWADSTTKALGLTQGRQLTLPAGLPQPAPKRNQAYAYTKSTLSAGTPSGRYYFDNVRCYRTK